MLFDNLFDCLSLFFEGGLLILLCLFLGFFNSSHSFGSFSGLSGVDFSNTLVCGFNNSLLLLLHVFVDSLIDLSLTLKFLHFVGNFALLVNFFHSLGLVGGGNSLDHFGVWSATRWSWGASINWNSIWYSNWMSNWHGNWVWDWDSDWMWDKMMDSV